jgi:hypothetical protein
MEVVGRALRVYVDSPHYFVIPFLVSGIISSLLYEYLDQIIPYDLDLPNVLSWITADVPAVAVAVALLFVIEWVNVVASGMVVKATSDLVSGDHVSFPEVAKQVRRRLLALLTAGVLTSVLTVTGLMLFLIPGVILIVVFSFVAPAIMIEGQGGLRSLGRSRQLVARCWSTTFAIQLLTFTMSTGLTWAWIAVEVPLGPWNAIFSTIASALIQPIKPIALTVLFHAIQQSQQPPPRHTPRGGISFCPQCGAKLNRAEEGCPNCGWQAEDPHHP